MDKQEVAVGILIKAGKILISERPSNKELGGYWEFPGGKLEGMESLQECLAREFMEKFGINVEVKGLICEIDHDYGDFEVALSFFECRTDELVLESKEGSNWKWSSLAELDGYKFLPANRALVNKLISLG